MNNRTHAADKQIFIRDQWTYCELRDEFKDLNFSASNNDLAFVLCIGS